LFILQIINPAHFPTSGLPAKKLIPKNPRFPENPSKTFTSPL